MATKYERITFAPSEEAEVAIAELIDRTQKRTQLKISRTQALNFFVRKGIETWTNEEEVLTLTKASKEQKKRT